MMHVRIHVVTHSKTIISEGCSLFVLFVHFVLGIQNVLDIVLRLHTQTQTHYSINVHTITAGMINLVICSLTSGGTIM